MPLEKQLLNHLQNCLFNVLGTAAVITGVNPVTGGDINQAYCLHTNAGQYMIKLNSKNAHPGMFRCESEGLAAIRNTQTVAVPGVVLQNHYQNYSFLILEWIDTMRATPAASAELGRQLAAMHRHTQAQFGFSGNNYMGSLPQSNRLHPSWTGFFVEERLRPMVELAAGKSLLAPDDVQLFERLYLKLHSLFDEEAPALLHGDLWGGNYLISTAGTPYLIDPAVSYGHREFDIAMTTLFGGFSSDFYMAYHEAFPLAGNWQQRTSLWNLYPLLLHLNLFGQGYLRQVRNRLKQYV